MLFRSKIRTVTQSSGLSANTFNAILAPAMATNSIRGLVLFAAAALLSLSFSHSAAIQATGPDDFAVALAPIEVDPQLPARKGFGAFQLLSAFHLRSKDHRFGGLSGLSIGVDGKLYAISDRGYWLSATMSSDPDGALSSLADWRIAPMLTTTKRPVRGSLRDAEALARSKDGSFLVGFEGAHRIWRYSPPPATFQSVPRAESTPPTAARAPRNGGIEALAEFPDGRLLALTEDFKNSDGSARGWLMDNGQWQELSYLPADGFRVTDCAALDDGDLLVLERRYVLFAIVAIRVTLVPASSLKPGAKIIGKELLRLEPPLAVENFEGIAAQQSAKGTTIFIVSDDNYSAFQQTLLLQFLLPNTAADALTTPPVP